MDKFLINPPKMKEIDFTNCVIIMTSNIGVKKIQDFGSGVGFGTAARKEQSEEHARGIIESALKKSFAPEFLNRIDDDTVIIPGHGALSNKAEYANFLGMISDTFNYVKALKQEGKSLDDVKAMGLEEKWASWSWNFINEEKWITTLYNDA